MLKQLTRQLVEQGKVNLDDPVENILPEIKEIKMLDGSEPKNKITLRMLVRSLIAFVGFLEALMRVLTQKGTKLTIRSPAIAFPYCWFQLYGELP